ncbi:MAG: GTPase ObgE [Candidatus Peribacteraceae bacterium]|jgi:GTP-binding protein
MFLDEAIITVQAGHGGPGCVSLRREKYVPRGGPDGGDGGWGGNVVFVADGNRDTLSDFSSKKRFKAEKGEFGMGKKCHGKNGADLILKVPAGTMVMEIIGKGEEKLLADLQEDGQSVIAARGGRGGYGNAHFTSSTRQTPDFAELGEPGEEKTFQLDLKLVADVGIIGLPSVGKSTLISTVSSARPKIAAYDFTTLIPNLGVASIDGRSFILCDVPGLIEGASAGKGLGDQFLRHIERCGILLHILDISRCLTDAEPDVQILVEDYRTIRTELEAYSPLLATKHELVILNKADLLGHDTTNLVKQLKKQGIDVFASISAATTMGTKELLRDLLPLVLQFRTACKNSPKEPRVLPVLQPHLRSEKMGSYTLKKQEDGTIVVKGKRLEQFVQMTDFSKEGGVRRLRDVFQRIGLSAALARERDEESQAPVYVGTMRIEQYL